MSSEEKTDALPLPELVYANEEEKKHVEELVARCKDKHADQPNDPRDLIRFLRARKGDVNAAYELRTLFAAPHVSPCLSLMPYVLRLGLRCMGSAWYGARRAVLTVYLTMRTHLKPFISASALMPSTLLIRFHTADPPALLG